MLHAVQSDDKWMLWWKNWFNTGFQYIMTFLFCLVYCNNYIHSHMQCTACLITFSHNKKIHLCPAVMKLLMWRSDITLIYFTTEIMQSHPILGCTVLWRCRAGAESKLHHTWGDQNTFATLIIMCMVLLLSVLIDEFYGNGRRVPAGYRRNTVSRDLVVWPGCMHADMTHLLLQVADLPSELSRHGMKRSCTQSVP